LILGGRDIHENIYALAASAASAVIYAGNSDQDDIDPEFAFAVAGLLSGAWLVVRYKMQQFKAGKVHVDEAGEE